MELNDINNLINRYFNGDTSQEDELMLTRYFEECRNLPEEHKVVKAMFDSFAQIRAEKPLQSVIPTPRRVISWRKVNRYVASIAAAVCGVICITAIVLTSAKEEAAWPSECLVCHIDGVRINDQSVAMAEANRILDGVAVNVQSAMQCVNSITNLSK